MLYSSTNSSTVTPFEFESEIEPKKKTPPPYRLLSVAEPHVASVKPVTYRIHLYDGVYVYDTPLGRFSMADISTVGIVPMPPPKVFVGKMHVAESFPEDVSLGIGTLLVVEQSTLESRPGVK